MKCLSICQPFANLIIQNKKTIELRKWNTNFRGEFLVHAPIKIRKEEINKYYPSINKAKSLINWSPKIDFERKIVSLINFQKRERE